jgi:hypothetical protein
MKSKNKNKFYIFLYFFIFFNFLIINKILYSSISPMQNNFGNNIMQSPLNGGTSDTPLNKYNWDSPEPIKRNKEIISQAQFNWQQRKIIKQKAYRIYVNLGIVIEDIKNIITKFESKVENIKQVLNELNITINNKCKTLGEQFLNPKDYLSYLNEWNNSISEFKKTMYYNLHKDFRKKIDTQWQYFENIKNMINHYQNSIFKMQNLGQILMSSVENLISLKEKAIAYEEQAWIKYQQLDDLIGDSIAQENYFEIVNCSDNSIAINVYLRNEFLDFFNQGMTNLNDANFAILAAIEDLIFKINETNSTIKQFSEEINKYDLEQKQKTTLELEQKIKEEQEKKLKEDKKQMAQKLAEEQKSWYEKIIPTVLNLWKSIINFINEIYNQGIASIDYYFKLIFKNEPIKIKNNISKNKKEINSTNTVVSEDIAQIKPIVDGGTTAIKFTSPDSNNNIKVTSGVDASQQKTLITDNIGIPGETKIEEDIFTKEHKKILQEEKQKLGASSYPQKINKDQTIVSIQPIIEAPVNTQIDLLTTENLSIPEIPSIPETNNNLTNKNSFQYQALEKTDISQNQDNNKLLPELDNIKKPREAIISNQGIQSSGDSTQLFQASGSNNQRHSKKREDREKSKEHDRNEKEKDYNKSHHHKQKKKKSTHLKKV